MKEWAIEEIIRVLGFEHPMTIWFCELCEQYPNADDDKIVDLLNAALELVGLAKAIEGE